MCIREHVYAVLVYINTYMTINLQQTVGRSVRRPKFQPKPRNMPTWQKITDVGEKMENTRLPENNAAAKSNDRQFPPISRPIPPISRPIPPISRNAVEEKCATAKAPPCELRFLLMQEPKGEGNWHGGRVAYSWDRVASRSLRVATSKGSRR